MPDRDENTARTEGGALANSTRINKRDVFRISCQYVDKLLADIDDILHASI